MLSARKHFILLVISLLAAGAVYYLCMATFLLARQAAILVTMATAVVVILVLHPLHGKLDTRKVRIFLGPLLVFACMAYGYARGEAVFPWVMAWGLLIFGSIDAYTRPEIRWDGE